MRDRRRNPRGLRIYRHSVFRGERISYRHRRQSGERHSSLCAVNDRRICRCLYHRFSCRHVRRTKKSRQRDEGSAYAPTAAWVAGVFNIIPALSFLGILGLYSFYLLYTGITGLMRPPSDKAVIYTIAVIVCAIIVWIVIFGLVHLLFGG